MRFKQTAFVNDKSQLQWILRLPICECFRRFDHAQSMPVIATQSRALDQLQGSDAGE